jgi:hypothetical protein
MTKSLVAAALLAFLGVATAAQAIPVITFQGVANTANVADFYNGGTDSIGNTFGYNYGIHFNAIAAENEAGAYVKGHASMSIAAGLFGAGVSYYILFNAAENTDIDGRLTFLSAERLSDSVYVGSNRNPYCSTEAQCLATGFRYIHPSQMAGYYLESNGSATTVSFNTDRLDNIQFALLSDPFVRPPLIAGASNLDRDIPEPASIALLGLGALGFVAARRRSARY